MSPIHPALLEVRIFGSHARGDAKASSDLDILCILGDKEQTTQHILAPEVEKLLGGPNPDISVYSKSRMSELFASGHLFAWHIFLESTPVWSRNTPSFISSLGRPAPYAQREVDAMNLATLSSEARTSLDAGRSIVYDLGIFYVCMRNIGLIASTKLSDRPIFGPSSPSTVSIPGVPFPLTRDEYALTRIARHASTRGVSPPSISKREALRLADMCNGWVQSASDWLQEK